MHLTTFLANDLTDSVTRAGKLAKYAESPGGSDYYWGFRLAARRLFLEDVPFDEAVGVMARMTVDHQRAANQEALRNLYRWKLGNPGISVEPPTGEIAGPKGSLIVRLDPAFAITRKGVTEAYVPWLYKDLRLPRAVGGMGVFLLELGLQTGEFENWKFYVMDFATMSRFGHGAIARSTGRAVVSALQAQEDLYLAAKAVA